jgi:hypothetical protein
MNFRSLPAALLWAAVLAPTDRSFAHELNLWPVRVVQHDERGARTAETGLGPFVFDRHHGPDGTVAGGLRPFYVEKRAADGRLEEAHVLYPLFSYRSNPAAERWSALNLVIRTRAGDAPATFDAWPFYFSRDTGDAATSYRAVFPLHGTVLNRFGQDRLSWTLFPLYGRWEKRGAVTTTAPWPFVKVLRGDGHSGFELWPLFGRRGREGDYREQFYLWPLVYKNEKFSGAARTDESFGVLPFYVRDVRPGYRSESYGPFFGYVDRTEPYRYQARHYFWPFWVTGRGDDRHVDRWAPFYTHSRVKGVDKTWLAWPLWRRATWTEAGLDHERRQFLYFLYHDTLQRSASNPDLPRARKTHLWPLVSHWNNGAGRRQTQILSPFEVFFPHNEPVRLAWSPFFALYRYDARGDDEVRHSLLWDAVTYRRHDEGRRRAFHFGPLFSAEAGPESRRFALGAGLVGLERRAGRGWRLFFGEFSRRGTTDGPPSP